MENELKDGYYPCTLLSHTAGGWIWYERERKHLRKYNLMFEDYSHASDIGKFLLGVLKSNKRENYVPPKIEKVFYTPCVAGRTLYGGYKYFNDDQDAFFFEHNMMCKTKEEAIELSMMLLDILNKKG